MMTTTRIFWMLSLFCVVFPFSNSSTYIFTQYQEGVSVCLKKTRDECIRGVPAIFVGNKPYGTGMTLGFLNIPSDKFYQDYDMAEYGFPIFYEWGFDDGGYVNFIIANGKLDTSSENGRGLYYYVQVKDFRQKCKTFPLNWVEAGAGALYLNQKYAKFAYFVYQSPTSTCILTLKFEDLLRGDFGSNKPTEIIPHKINIIDYQIMDYIRFTIDPIFGTMVYLIQNDTQYYIVHYKINENNLDVLEEVYRFEIHLAPWSELKMQVDDPRSPGDQLPFFTSYGKFATMFYSSKRSDDKKFVEYFSPNVSQSVGNGYDDFHQRIFYLLDEHLFEDGEPLGKFIEPTTTITSFSLETTTTTSYESSSLAISKATPQSCRRLTGYFWGFIASLILDILFAGILGAVIFLSYLGSKRRNNNKGKILKVKPLKRTKKSIPHQSKTVLPQTDLNSRPSTNLPNATTQATTNITKAGPPQTTVFKTWEQSNASGTPGTGGGTTQKTTAFQTWKNN